MAFGLGIIAAAFLAMGIRNVHFGLISFVITLLLASQASAALGEKSDSLENDRASLSASTLATKTFPDYSVQEMEAGGTRVREYVSNSGVVFGIAWDGLTHPDLHLLLGNYASDYERGLQESPRKRGRRSRSVRTGRVVVEKSGHMRNLHGRAYVPSLIPAGVSVDEIQ